MNSGAASPSADHAATVPHRILTGRVETRAYEIADAEALDAAMAANHVRLREWMPWAWDEPQTLETRRNLLSHFRTRFEAGEDFTMGMFDRESGALLGGTGLHPRVGPGVLEIGYWLTADAEGRGLMTEVAGALTQVALGLGLTGRVEIHCDPANTRSRAVPSRLGYVLEDTRPGPAGSADEGRATEYWALELARYAESPLAASPRPALADAAGREIGWPA
ncbi:GNAT family N-acetyltransferase [Demequina aurantiaca]|uniref:GNAT family N-acetyltransferase n=1 Tax=Demequina aurantiaca TaxID=676200 RepID=UPI003D32DFAF